MKICITAAGNSMEADVDPRFGRCQSFIFYDTETDNFEAVANDNAAGMGGVGIQNAALMAEKNVEVVITGNLGPNASGVLRQAKIKAITGVSGKVRDAVENFKNGKLKADPSPAPTVTSHFGMERKNK